MKKNFTRVASTIVCSFILLFSLNTNAQKNLISFWDFNQTRPFTGAGGDSLGTIYSYTHTLLQDTTVALTWPLFANYTTNAPSTAQVVVKGHPNGANQSYIDNANGGSHYYDYSSDHYNYYHGSDSNGSGGNEYVRARNPVKNDTVFMYLPTTGYQNIQLNYAISASSTKGANYIIFSYSTNGGTTWNKLTTAMDTFNIGGIYRPDTLQMLNPITVASNWYPVNMNFTSDASVNNNASFVLRWVYGGANVTQTSGNNRYDNFSLTGDSLCPVIALQPVNAALCGGGGNTDFLVNTKGGTTVTYQWQVNSGSGFGNVTNGGIYSGALTGELILTGANSVENTYQYRCVVSNTGCGTLTSNMATLTVDPVLNASISSTTNVTCTGNGSATANQSGGTSPYTYLWNDLSSQTTITASNLTSGTYTVTVSDAAGCTATASATINQVGLALALSSIKNEECTDGGATATASNGTAPYTYNWSDGETTATATALTAGTYTVTAQDITSCSATAAITISQNAPLRDSITGAGIYQVIHYWDFNNTPPTGGGGGDSLGNVSNPLNAEYSLLSGENPHIVYSYPAAIQTTPYVCTQVDGITDNLTPGAGVNDLPLLGNDTASSAAGNLAIRARNPSENAFMYLYLPTTGYQNIQLNYALSASSTKGANYNVFSYSTNGGTTWKNLTTAMDTFNIGGIYRPDTLQAINPTTAASLWYPVNINFSSDPAINNNPNFIVRFELEGPNTNGTSGNDRYDNVSLSGNFITETCNGASNYSAVAGVKDGQSPYTYSWTPNVSSTATASDISAGTYTVDVTDANGCSLTASISVSQPTVVSATIASQTGVSCNGNSDGGATITASGGISPYSYSWTGGSTINSISGVSAGIYTVTITDNMACTGTATVSITQPIVLTASATATANEICNGGNNGNASSTANGGTGPYTYSWSGGAGTNATATGLSATTYTLSVTDNNGCTATATTTITQPLAINVTTGTTATGCSPSGTATVSSVTNGISPYTYLWTGGATTVTISGLSAGTYTVNLTDKNGCTASATATVTEVPTLTVTTTAVTNENCNGNNTGSTSSGVSGGVSPYTYSWSPTGGSNSAASGLTAGTYTLHVTDNNGCIGSASVTVTQPTAITMLKYSTPSSVGNCDGSAWVSIGGGISPYTYAWTGAVSTSDSIFAQCNGSYCCTVTDNHGCTDSVCITIKSSAGIDNVNDGGTSINIYPDPNTGYFTISGVTQGQVIELYDYTGRKLSSVITDNSTAMQFDISNRPNGIYLIRIQNKDGSVATFKKIVKVQ